MVVKSDRRGPRSARAMFQALEPSAIGIPCVNHSAALQHRGELKCFPAGTCAEIQELIAGTSFHESAEHLTALILNFEKASLMSTESKNVWSRCLNVKGVPGKQSAYSLDTFGLKLSRQILSGNSERIRSQRHGPGQVESVRERVRIVFAEFLAKLSEDQFCKPRRKREATLEFLGRTESKVG